MRDIDKILSNIDDDDQLEKLLREDSSESGKGGQIAKKEAASDVLESVDNTLAQSGAQKQNKNKQPKEDKKVEKPEFIDIEIQFSIKGTKSWNTRDPYVIEIEKKQLHEDTLNLNESFFFIKEPAEESTIREEAKKAVLNSLRTQKQGIEQEYSEFINFEIKTEINDLMKFFIKDQVLDSLFVFHMGPNTVFRILQNKFVKHRYGFCYKSVSSNKAIRFLPEEYIKLQIVNWFEANINNQSIDFDSIQQYEIIRSVISKKYQIAEKEFSKKLYEINSKIEPQKNISKEKLLRMKGDLWFGQSRILIYKRFVNKTIFQ